MSEIFLQKYKSQRKIAFLKSSYCRIIFLKYCCMSSDTINKYVPFAKSERSNEIKLSVEDPDSNILPERSAIFQWYTGI
jgi:hypothetical protein